MRRAQQHFLLTSLSPQKPLMPVTLFFVQYETRNSRQQVKTIVFREKKKSKNNSIEHKTTLLHLFHSQKVKIMNKSNKQIIIGEKNKEIGKKKSPSLNRCCGRPAV